MKSISYDWISHWKEQRMGPRKAIFFSVFSVWLLTLVAAHQETKLVMKEPLLAYLISTGEINQEMAELLRINCKVELMHAKEVFDDFAMLAPKERSSSSNMISSGSSRFSAGVDNALHPWVKQTLLDCLRSKNLMLSGEERHSRNWYTRYIDFLFGRTDARKRRKLAEVEAPAPSPIISPNAAPSSEASGSHLIASPPVQPFFPPNVEDSSLQHPGGEHSSPNANDVSNVQSTKQKSNKKTVVIAVVVTASSTFVVAALLYVCWNKVCCTGSRMGRNDEKPLLSLSMSDYSIASPHKSFALGGSVNGQKQENQAFNNSSNYNRTDGNFYNEQHALSISTIEIPAGAVAAATANPVQQSVHLPPGNLPGLPPLKPPPGRAGPSPSKAAPPPPPVPPPPPMNPSGGSHPPPGPPPVPSGNKTGPRPPPPPPLGGSRPPQPGGGIPPVRPPPIGLKPPRPSPLGPNHPSTNASVEGEEVGAPKTKLKPFFWDKVLANPEHSMVWNQIKSGSFQFDEEMIETLFGYAPQEKNKKFSGKDSSSKDPASQFIQLIDPRKAQNLSILLKALNVTTEEVCDALQEGNELPVELLQTLLKMAPTTDEELKLRLYSGDLSRLGLAERFLKTLVDIPFAFKRLESLLFMCTLQEEASTVKESFTTLEAACTELRKSRLFLKLLEAVLKTGNRMNDGTFRGGAQAFKLDTLLKLSDVKGIDGKTTLLHFVVQEIINSEGVRAARTAKESIKSNDLVEDSSEESEEYYRSIGLQVVSGLGGDLENVKKAAILDADSLTGTVSKLGHALIKARDFLNSEMKNVDEENGFHMTLKNFVQNAEVDIMWLLEEEKRILAVVKSTGDYFHGNSGKDEGLRLFVIVRDFLIILDKVCGEVKKAPKRPNRAPKKEEPTGKTSESKQPPPDLRQRLFPAIADRRIDSSSSDEDDP